jgi:transposase
VKQKQHLSSSKKMEIVRELLENQESISEIAEKYNVGVQDIYRWKKQLFESTEIFERKKHGGSESERKINNLEEKLRSKDSVISELVVDNIALKKKLTGDY